MRFTHLLTAAAAALAVSACSDQGGGNNQSGGGSDSAAAVPPPEGGDWTKVVSTTPAGGFVMGNPNAPVKVVEFGSMTCPHCAAFDEEGFEALSNNYVKKGRVAFEFRNYVRDPLDITLALIARCGGEERFFPLTDAMFNSQKDFFAKIQGADQAQQQALAQLPPAQQFAGYAQLAGLQQWAAQRGVPTARQQQCLSNQAEIERLVQMNADAGSTYDVQGTPTFLINDKVVEGSTWATLEPKIKDAL